LSTDRLPWHGYQSFGHYLIANALLMPLLAITGWVALALADDRYVNTAEMSGAVQQIQVGQAEQTITTLDTQLQIAHRRLDAASEPREKQEIEDEIRVLEDAKAAAERQRQKLMR
jgi:hypothetical protein